MAHDTYRRIQKGMTEYRLARIDLASRELEFNQRSRL